MSFLKRAIQDGIRKGVGDALGNAVRQAIQPKATELANKAAQHLDQAAGTAARQAGETAGSLEGALQGLERAAQSYATQLSKNVKLCPECQTPATAEKTFCPSCGAKLPEQTISQSAVCPDCGKQNSIGTRFCQDCGAKLPLAIEEERAAQARDAQTMLQWDQLLPQYPKWSCGGCGYNLEDYDGNILFAVKLESHTAAQAAVERYRAVLRENGFREAGQYPDPSHLYRKVDGVCYHVDTEHCFDGDADTPTIYFSIGEPSGGFDYVKPEPRKPTSLRDLFKF